MTQLELLLDNKKIYTHNSSNEANMKSISEQNLKIIDTTTGAYMYVIPYKAEMHRAYQEQGLPGVNFKGWVPVLNITTSQATGAYNLYLTTFNRAKFVIKDRVGALTY